MNAVPRVVSTSAVVALVLATLWLFWPSALGGGTTYVSTHGTSMQPRFHTGDLAVLSPGAPYVVGDVIAYHSDNLHTIVMHRIVAVEGDRVVTKGDNNDWLDADHPTQREILGRLFLRIPHGGEVLSAVRSPGLLLSLASGVLCVLGAMHDPRGRRTARWMRRRAPVFAMSTRGRARQVALGAGVAVLASTVGCAVLLTLPSTQTDTRDLQVTEKSEFSYTGKAAPGTTYPTGVLRTGDTVWNRLVHDLTVSLTAAVEGPGVTGLTGSLRLDVVVTAADGWSSVVNTGSAAPLQNGTATAVVGVDPQAAMELLSRHYKETGSPSGGATLTVRPVSDAAGTVQGHAFKADAPHGLGFTLDEMSLRPTATDAATLAPTTETSVPVQDVVPRRLTVLAASVPIGVARKLVGAVLLLSLFALSAGAWVGRIGRGDVSGRFLARHADRILPVASFSPGATVIDVSDAESLHRVAERFDTVVLHHSGPEEEVFAVRDLDATYRFVVPASADRAGGRPPVPPPVARSVPVDATTPLERIRAVDAALWGRVA